MTNCLRQFSRYQGITYILSIRLSFKKSVSFQKKLHPSNLTPQLELTPFVNITLPFPSRFYQVSNLALPLVVWKSLLRHWVLESKLPTTRKKHPYQFCVVYQHRDHTKPQWPGTNQWPPKRGVHASNRRALPKKRWQKNMSKAENTHWYRWTKIQSSR